MHLPSRIQSWPGRGWIGWADNLIFLSIYQCFKSWKDFPLGAFFFFFCPDEIGYRKAKPQRYQGGNFVIQKVLSMQQNSNWGTLLTNPSCFFCKNHISPPISGVILPEYSWHRTVVEQSDQPIASFRCHDTVEQNPYNKKGDCGVFKYCNPVFSSDPKSNDPLLMGQENE